MNGSGHEQVEAGEAVVFEDIHEEEDDDSSDTDSEKSLNFEDADAEILNGIYRSMSDDDIPKLEEGVTLEHGECESGYSFRSRYCTDSR